MYVVACYAMLCYSQFHASFVQKGGYLPCFLISRTPFLASKLQKKSSFHHPLFPQKKIRNPNKEKRISKKTKNKNHAPKTLSKEEKPAKIHTSIIPYQKILQNSNQSKPATPNLKSSYVCIPLQPSIPRTIPIQSAPHTNSLLAKSGKGMNEKPGLLQ